MGVLLLCSMVVFGADVVIVVLCMLSTQCISVMYFYISQLLVVRLFSDVVFSSHVAVVFRSFSSVHVCPCMLVVLCVSSHLVYLLFACISYPYRFSPLSRYGVFTDDGIV